VRLENLTTPSGFEDVNMWKSFEWPKIADKKCDSLENKGFKPVGVVLENADGSRVSVDRHGRVVWQDKPTLPDSKNVLSSFIL